MAETRRYGLGAQLDIDQILLEAQHRWLRPAEICEILRNYKRFRIAPEPANRPPNGSLFLFDRKVLRYFRKDGHNWRKKRDGKTVKEAHERLKAGSIDVLHCYYAHGEENENFQRRSYWMLEEELSHIVLVHYREVKGNRTNFNRTRGADENVPISQQTEETLPNSEVDSSASSDCHPHSYRVNSQTTDTISLNSGQASEYEDAESAYSHQATSGFHSFLELQSPVMKKIDERLSAPYYPEPYSNNYQEKLPAVPGIDVFSLSQGGKGDNSTSAGLTYESRKYLDHQLLEDLIGNRTAGVQSVPFQPSLSATQSDMTSISPGQGHEIIGQVFTDGFGKKQEFEHGNEEWQFSSGYNLPCKQTSEGNSSLMFKWNVNQKVNLDSGYDLTSRFPEEVNCRDFINPLDPYRPHTAEQNKHPMQTEYQNQLTNVDNGTSLKMQSESTLNVEGKADYTAVKQPLLDGLLREGLKKLDSFDRWMSKELGDVNESHVQPSSGSYWDTVESEDGVGDSSLSPQEHLDSCMLGPSLSHDQLFSIIDFSPNWAYAGSEIKVLITGRFLKSRQDVEKINWSCMFGELEVPAEVIADGVLRCHSPLHQAGRVPFYVTCSNRLACSEVREFEYKPSNSRDFEVAHASSGSTDEFHLHTRFAKFLSLGSVTSPNSVPVVGENSYLCSTISSYFEENNNEWDAMSKHNSENEFSTEKVKEQLLQKLLKEKLHVWLLQKVAEGGKGPSILDEDGQGVLHFAAALGYDWAIPPTIAAGVSINFRDVNGWTALHWAASCGRERTVGFLISQDAAPGALTDPTPNYPSGRTPADLASSNGHKGIAGYLAELALRTQLLSLELKDNKEGDALEISGVKAAPTLSEQTATPISDGDSSHGLSLKDSLAAVCNATQAAARIYQLFRVQSFQEKQAKEYEDDKHGMTDERALSRLAVRTNRPGHHEPVHAAATRIQSKFRSWKGRREFLTIRQRIVKIQAHVRGHQVRKNYRKIIWSVGIVEKVILRWRRKGSGLRGFRPESQIETSMEETSAQEDEYDFLKQGRKQTEERLQKALARVKSMVQYPEARDQYSRLLNVVSEIKGTKASSSGVLNSSEGTSDFDEDLIDIDALLDDDSFMSAAS